MKVKLQKHFAYRYKEKKHYKHVIVIPEEAINQLGWEAGKELDIKVNDGRLIVQVNKKSKKIVVSR